MYTEKQKLDIKPLKYKVSSFVKNKEPRHIIQNKETYKPIPSMSLYEAYLYYKNKSYRTVQGELSNLCYFLTWADMNGVDANRLLLLGQPLDEKYVRSFASWVRNRGYEKNKKKIKLGLKTRNKIIRSVGQAFKFFISQYAGFNGDVNEKFLKKSNILKLVDNLFNAQLEKERNKSKAPDLTEKEIQIIEDYLRPENLSKAKAHEIRDYLMWRLVLEFGLRIGEILALRLEDCPHKQQDYIKIVRIEERGDNYYDPRTPNAPRPKTLSRDLGFLIDNSPIKKLISEYTTRHRFKVIEKFGEKKRVPIISNPSFLILNHKRNNGLPLSITSAQKIAQRISKDTGVHFNWHLGRHAFFNRAYSSIIESSDFYERKMDLVYWGGWEAESSLDIYIQKARDEKAQKALSFWHDSNRNEGDKR